VWLRAIIVAVEVFSLKHAKEIKFVMTNATNII
jgi:hypothetical protein